MAFECMIRRIMAQNHCSTRLTTQLDFLEQLSGASKSVRPAAQRMGHEKTAKKSASRPRSFADRGFETAIDECQRPAAQAQAFAPVGDDDNGWRGIERQESY